MCGRGPDLQPGSSTKKPSSSENREHDIVGGWVVSGNLRVSPHGSTRLSLALEDCSMGVRRRGSSGQHARWRYAIDASP